jgi:hypothetical protein
VSTRVACQVPPPSRLNDATGAARQEPRPSANTAKFHAPRGSENLQNPTPIVPRFPLIFLACCAAGTLPARSETPPKIVQTTVLAAPEANQAACADERFVYAIDSKLIAKYDRASGRQISVSTGDAHHLNSGYLWQGKIYCAHSNYPRKPEKSEIMVLDPETMVLSQFKNFGEYRGSLTWVLREGEVWWCNFAHYGADNAKTVLLKLDANWGELGAWTYPAEVIKELGQYSISGGICRDGLLLTTGHDHKVIYRLRLPAKGDVLELVDVLPSPFPGQGIATDPKTGALIGIDRSKRQIVFAELR